MHLTVPNSLRSEIKQLSYGCRNLKFHAMTIFSHFYRLSKFFPQQIIPIFQFYMFNGYFIQYKHFKLWKYYKEIKINEYLNLLLDFYMFHLFVLCKEFRLEYLHYVSTGSSCTIILLFQSCRGDDTLSIPHRFNHPYLLRRKPTVWREN